MGNTNYTQNDEFFDPSPNRPDEENKQDEESVEDTFVRLERLYELDIAGQLNGEEHGPRGVNGPPGVDGPIGQNIATLYCDQIDNPLECPFLELVKNADVIYINRNSVLKSLRLGHIECCRIAILRNRGEMYISSLFEDGNRSVERLAALDLFLEFKFPIDEEILQSFHEQSPFCDEMVDALNSRGIRVIH